MAGSKYSGLRIEIVCDSEAQLERWREAKGEGVPLGKFLKNVIDGALMEDEAEKFRRSQDVKKIIEENQALKIKERSLVERVDKFEKENERLRNLVFLEREGQAFGDPALTSILKAGPIHDNKLLDALGIDPSQTDLMRALNRQLEFLEAEGFIRRNSQGWVWVR